MTISDLLNAVDTLSAEELVMLRERLEQRQHHIAGETPDQLEHALDRLREGLTDEQLDQIEWAMNIEIIQPPDVSAWQE